MKRFLWALMLLPLLAKAQVQIPTEVYLGNYPVAVENSNNTFAEVLTRQGGKSVSFVVPFDRSTIDSMRIVARFVTNTAGTATIKLENTGLDIAPTITVSGVVDTQMYSSWVYTGGKITAQTFKAYAKHSSANGDIYIYYLAYQVLQEDVGGGGGGGGSTETITIKEAGGTVGSATNHSLDFQAGFDVLENPASEFNISIDPTETNWLQNTYGAADLDSVLFNMSNKLNVRRTAIGGVNIEKLDSTGQLALRTNGTPVFTSHPYAVYSQQDGNDLGMVLAVGSGAGGRGRYIGLRDRGNLGTFTALNNGNVMVGIEGWGANGASYEVGGRLSIASVNAWTALRRGSGFLFQAIDTSASSAIQNYLTMTTRHFDFEGIPSDGFTYRWNIPYGFHANYSATFDTTTGTVAQASTTPDDGQFLAYDAVFRNYDPVDGYEVTASASQILVGSSALSAAGSNLLTWDGTRLEVGLDETTPAGLAHFHKSGSAAVIIAQSEGASPALYLRQGSGTEEVPGPTSNGSSLGSVEFYGTDNNGVINSSPSVNLRGRASEGHTTTGKGGELDIRLIPTGSTTPATYLTLSPTVMTLASPVDIEMNNLSSFPTAYSMKIDREEQNAIVLDAYSDTGYPLLVGRRWRDSFASPDPVTNGSFLISMRGYGWDGSTMNDVGRVSIAATGTHSPSSHPTAVFIQTVANGSTTLLDSYLMKADTMIFGGLAPTFRTRLHIATPTAYRDIDLPNASGEISLLGQTIGASELVETYLLESGDTFTGNLIGSDGSGDSPTFRLSPQSGTTWDWFAQDSDDDLQFRSSSTGSTEEIDIGNPGAGTVTVNVEGTVAATTVTGANVTTGADPGHTHTGASVSGIYNTLSSWMWGNLAATQTDLQATRPAAASSLTVGFAQMRQPFAGSIVGISVAGNAATTTSTATFTVWVNGVATALSVVIDAGGQTTRNYATNSGIAFSAGDDIDVRVTTTGTFAPAGSTEFAAEVWVTY